MKHNLKLIPEQGYVLTKLDPPIKCFICGKDLEVPYFFCDEFGNGRCKSCERNTKERTCRNMDKVHEHYNIIQVKKPLIDQMLSLLF